MVIPKQYVLKHKTQPKIYYAFTHIIPIMVHTIETKLIQKKIDRYWKQWK